MLQICNRETHLSEGNYELGVTDFDKIGGYMNDGYAIYSTTNQHNATIINFTVSDKMNVFFGGTHQIITNVRIFDSISGSIINGSNFMQNSSWITLLKW